MELSRQVFFAGRIEGLNQRLGGQLSMLPGWDHVGEQATFLRKSFLSLARDAERGWSDGGQMQRKRLSRFDPEGGRGRSG